MTFLSFLLAAILSLRTGGSGPILAVSAMILEVGARSDAATRITNMGEDSLVVQIQAVPFDQTDDGTYQAQATTGDCGARLHYFPRRVVLAPSATQTVRVLVDRSVAGCWTSLAVDADGPAMGEDGVRAIVKVYATGARAEGRAWPGIVEASGWNARADTAMVTFTNPADSPLRAQGVVRRVRGDRVIASAVVPPFSTLPGHVRRLKVALPAPADARGPVPAAADSIDVRFVRAVLP